MRYVDKRSLRKVRKKQCKKTRLHHDKLYYLLFIMSGFKLGECHFEDERSGLLSLAPHGKDKLALLLIGSSVPALQDLVALATPTIPPMTRSPVCISAWPPLPYRQ